MSWTMCITPETPGAAGGDSLGEEFAAWLTDHGVEAEQTYCIELRDDDMVVFGFKRGPNGEARVCYGGRLAIEEPRVIPIRSACPITSSPFFFSDGGVVATP